MAVAASVMLAACSPALDQPVKEPVDAARITGEVEARFATLAEAAKALDHEAYFEHFNTGDLTVLNADGTLTNGFEPFRESYLAGVAALAAYRSLDFDEVAVRALGPGAAILVNEYEAEVELASGDVVRFAGAGTQVWQRADDGTWKIVHVSSSLNSGS
ncbi:MAG: nuclear transport factor 2 family protein [Pseudomonadota bacterium]